MKPAVVRIFVSTLFFLPIQVKALDYSIDSYLQWHVAYRLSEGECNTTQQRCSVPFNDQRVQLKMTSLSDSGTFDAYAKLEILHDSVDDETLPNGETSIPVENLYEFRELYVKSDVSPFLFTVGRQVVTWGVGDVLIINDIFPKDWISFYSGQPLEYLKRGMDMAKVNMYFDWLNIELIGADFREDRLPINRVFNYQDPAFGQLPANIEEPNQLERAIRLSRYLGSWDFALYASDTYARKPTYKISPADGQAFYPQLSTYGMSLSGPLFGGVVNFEFGHLSSDDDKDGNHPYIDNSADKVLIGYNYQIANETSIGVQYFLEIMNDYEQYRDTLSAGISPEEKYQRTSTLRLTQQYLHNTLTANVFLLWEHTYQDGFGMASIRYAFTDNFWSEIGATTFYGKTEGQFAQLKDNDLLYLTFRYAL